MIAKYAPAEALKLTFGKPHDVDGDGRLDLPTNANIRLVEDISCGYPSEWKGAKFVAHSLANGSFSMDDDVAKKFARAWCPQSPPKIEKTIDAACARLWARSPAEIAAARKRVAACVPWDCAAEMNQQPQPAHAERLCGPRIQAFDATPPFTLP